MTECLIWERVPTYANQSVPQSLINPCVIVTRLFQKKRRLWSWFDFKGWRRRYSVAADEAERRQSRVRSNKAISGLIEFLYLHISCLLTWAERDSVLGFIDARFLFQQYTELLAQFLIWYGVYLLIFRSRKLRNYHQSFDNVQVGRSSSSWSVTLQYYYSDDRSVQQHRTSVITQKIRLNRIVSFIEKFHFFITKYR